MDQRRKLVVGRRVDATSRLGTKVSIPTCQANKYPLSKEYRNL